MPWRIGSMPVQTRFSVFRGLSDTTPGPSGFTPPEAVPSKFASPRRTLPEGLPRWLTGQEILTSRRADASMATPANAPTSRVSDVSWTSLVLVHVGFSMG